MHAAETLKQQLGICFRFGLAVAADPQLWWDSFRYCRDALGHEHGLVGLVGPKAAIALPVTGGRWRRAAATRCGLASLPCVLGLHRRRQSGGGKHAIAPPPSAIASFGALVRWELAMVKAFGITFPKQDAERLPATTFGAELLFAVAEARREGDAAALRALSELMGVYEGRLGSLLRQLRAAMEASPRPEEVLLEPRPAFAPFWASCSPRFAGELLAHVQLSLSEPSFHETHALLEERLGLLRLRPVVGRERAEGAEALAREASDDEQQVRRPLEAERQCLADELSDGAGPSAEKEASDANEPHDKTAQPESHTDSDDDGSGGGDDDAAAEDDDVCDEATWGVLQRLLGFRHEFHPADCAELLYTSLAPALVNPPVNEPGSPPTGGHRRGDGWVRFGGQQAAQYDLGP